MAISYIYNGEPMTGTANDDFFIAFKGSTGTDNNTINANLGDDLVIGDSSDTWIPGAAYLNNAIGTAFNLEGTTGPWTTAENEMFGDWTIPHTTVISEATIGQSEFFRVQIGAGQQITIDIDYASNTAIGITSDLVVELQDSLGNVIVTADDSLVSQGGRGSSPSAPGSASSYDPYLTYTTSSAGIYFINVRPFGAGPGSTFTQNNTFVMNVSVTGHAVSATNPVQGADTINGGEGDDALYGQGGADVINGDAGNDFIDGGSGGDIIHGGEGDDTVYGGDGTEENAHGDNGNDTLISGGEGHYYGDAGDDVIYAGLTSGINEILDGGTDVDTIDTTTWNGGYSINLVTGATNFGELFTNFENVVTGNGGDTITGTAGDNVIWTQGGVDTVTAGAGNDVVRGGALGDTLDGGTDSDTLDYRTSPGAVTINLAANTASGGDAAGDLISNFENVWGSVLGDTLMGSSGANALSGFEGNDTINGGDGDDVIAGGLNSDILDGGTGVDVLDYRASSAPVTIDLAAGTATGGDATGDTIANFEGAYGADGGGDSLKGDSGDNVLSEFGGADTLLGVAGDDTLDGGSDNDTLNGGSGADAMSGGLGDDTYYVDSAGDTVTDLPGEGTDTVRSSVNFTLGDGTEVLVLTGTADLTGKGSDGDNTIYGNSGNNVLNGRFGNDVIKGGDGSDTISGGSSDDSLDGGVGNDAMSGGDGDDTYYVNSAGDTVTELAGSGVDAVVSSVSWGLGAETENLTLITNASLNGTGNDLDNTIVGNNGVNDLKGFDGNDTLKGLGGGDNLNGGGGNDSMDGGTGDDAMAGGSGDDTYVVDSLGDTVTDLVGSGTDTVKSSVNWTLGAETENLILTGAANSSGTGNANDNTISGNGSSNALTGLAGNDTISGGGGGDTIDGGKGNDVIDGGADNDSLVGGGGADSLNGGSGSDTLGYNGVNESTGANYDTIVAFDFKNADKLDLDVTVTGIDAEIAAGHPLSQGSFNADLVSAIGAAQLAVNHAVLFTPTIGGLAGTTFLVVDANGVAGYQANADYVFRLDGPVHLVQLDASDFI